MTLSHCGDQGPDHVIRRCSDCRRIARARLRAMRETPELAAVMNPTCRSCRVRYVVAPPTLNEDYNPGQMSAHAVRWLENAALMFEKEADGELFTASEFVAWLKPDIKGHAVAIPEVDGKSVQKGGHAPRHNMADPIPYYKRERVA